MKLLIVEDNPQMRRLIVQMMRKSTDAIFECDDGEQALAAYREHQPDWVFMDVEMPVVDGITATREILAAFPEAQIAIVTEYNDSSQREAAREAGACQFVAKENLHELTHFIFQDHLTTVEQRLIQE